MKNKTIILFFAASLVAAVWACKKDAGKDPKAPDLSQLKSDPTNPTVLALTVGQQILDSISNTMSRQLQAALAEGGVAQAMQYCQMGMYPLIEQLSAQHNVMLRRTSMKPRNPNNVVTVQDMPGYRSLVDQLSVTNEIRPVVRKEDNFKAVLHSPILMKEFCLQCHGRVNMEIREADYALIKEQYPKDGATGYRVGDLRGMWTVYFRE